MTSLLGRDVAHLIRLAVLLLVCMVLVRSAVRRIRQGHLHGWHMLWCGVAAWLLALSIRPSLVGLQYCGLSFRQAVLAQRVALGVWVAYALCWVIVPELIMSRAERAARR